MSELTQHEQIVQAFNQYLAEAETFDEAFLQAFSMLGLSES